MVAADLDTTGDMDLVCCAEDVSSDDRRIVWYENTDGQGHFSSANGLPQTNDTPGKCEVLTGDLDSDGDLDLLAVFDEPDSVVVWYENLLPLSISSPTTTPTPPPTMA